MEEAVAEYTKRAVVPELEKVLYAEHKVLDHGFVRVIDYMGSDAAIVQAARVSYGKGTKQASKDAALINYLMRHAHTSPFEMCEIKFHIKLPIFVARQWIRHRTANINECSARYSLLDREFYVPCESQMMKQSNTNAQGREELLPAEVAQELLETLKRSSEHMYDEYELSLDKGLTRELARLNLTVNYYTQWYWKIDLNNLLRFLKLRSGCGAQYEIRVYAEKILEIIELWVPMACAAFVEHSLKAETLSRSAVKVVRRLLQGEKVSQEESGIGKREWNELMSVFYPEG